MKKLLASSILLLSTTAILSMMPTSARRSMQAIQRPAISIAKRGLIEYANYLPIVIITGSFLVCSKNIDSDTKAKHYGIEHNSRESTLNAVKALIVSYAGYVPTIGTLTYDHIYGTNITESSMLLTKSAILITSLNACKPLTQALRKAQLEGKDTDEKIEAIVAARKTK